MNELLDAVNRFRLGNHDRKYQSRANTSARVGMGHAGGHLTTNDWLNLQADFSRAKDAVLHQLNLPFIENLCQKLQHDYVVVHSQASNNMEYLLRPDLGRMLADESAANLIKVTEIQRDVLLVISGGLSAQAIEMQVPDFLTEFSRSLTHSRLSLAPIIINPRGRVALGDAVNEMLCAKITIVLIGERPGLGVSESMGIYFTYNARTGCTDAERNCISNVHANGLSAADAVLKLNYLINKSLACQFSGVDLKDDQAGYLTLL